MFVLIYLLHITGCVQRGYSSSAKPVFHRNGTRGHSDQFPSPMLPAKKNPYSIRWHLSHSASKNDICTSVRCLKNTRDVDLCSATHPFRHWHTDTGTPALLLSSVVLSVVDVLRFHVMGRWTVDDQSSSISRTKYLYCRLYHTSSIICRL